MYNKLHTAAVCSGIYRMFVLYDAAVTCDIMYQVSLNQTRTYLCFEFRVEGVGASAEQLPYGGPSFHAVLGRVVAVLALARVGTNQLSREALAVPIITHDTFACMSKRKKREKLPLKIMSVQQQQQQYRRQVHEIIKDKDTIWQYYCTCKKTTLCIYIYIYTIVYILVYTHKTPEVNE